MATYLGIDPGALGGFAIVNTLHNAGITRVETAKMPRTLKEVWRWLQCIGSHGQIVPHIDFAAIERVHAMPGNGVAGMFRFGVNYGSLLMALTAAGIPYEEVSPQVWQKALDIKPRKSEKVDVWIRNREKSVNKTRKVFLETKREFKKRLQAFAQELYPSEAVTLATSDALLIAEYCRRKQEGKL